ncbi:MAG: hypothetical protein SGBAC_008841 [Bacillariaceae sp.]
MHHRLHKWKWHLRSLILLAFLNFLAANYLRNLLKNVDIISALGFRDYSHVDDIRQGTKSLQVQTTGNKKTASGSEVNKKASNAITKVNEKISNANTIYNDVLRSQSSDTAPVLSRPHSQTLVANDGNSTIANRIPQHLIFTYSKNLLQVKIPNHLHENVMKTIKTYADAWGIGNNSKVEVLFYTDKECLELLKQVEPKYLPIFQTESFPAYRGDICRAAALYVYGGYYLDVDIQPLKPLDPLPGVDFITAKMKTGIFFQAIIAATPRHPVLKAALESMLIDWYMIPSALRAYNKSETAFDFAWYRIPNGNYDNSRAEHLRRVLPDLRYNQILMGPATLRLAFDRKRNVTTPLMLEEFNNTELNLYPQLMRKEGSTKYKGCNFLVHDPENMTAYFYSRCRGMTYCP